VTYLASNSLKAASLTDLAWTGSSGSYASSPYWMTFSVKETFCSSGCISAVTWAAIVEKQKDRVVTDVKRVYGRAVSLVASSIQVRGGSLIPARVQNANNLLEHQEIFAFVFWIQFFSNGDCVAGMNSPCRDPKLVHSFGSPNCHVATAKPVAKSARQKASRSRTQIWLSAPSFRYCC
jgi:hypothetical protein